MGRNKIIAIISIIIIAVATGVTFFIYQRQFGAPQNTTEKERIVININTTESELIPKLRDQGYIRSEWAFSYVLKNKGWQGKIEPGE